MVFSATLRASFKLILDFLPAGYNWTTYYCGDCIPKVCIHWDSEFLYVLNIPQVLLELLTKFQNVTWPTHPLYLCNKLLKFTTLKSHSPNHPLLHD